MTDTEKALLSAEIKKDGHFNNYYLFYPNGAEEKITTLEAVQFLVAQKKLDELTPK